VSDAGLSSADKDARIAELEAALAVAQADISARDILIDTLRVQIARLKRMQFGQSSEKLTTQIAQLELAYASGAPNNAFAAILESWGRLAETRAAAGTDVESILT